MEQEQNLVLQWTKKAQSSNYTDQERNIYYECAKELYETQQRIVQMDSEKSDKPNKI